jgi:hypothetical protein
VLEKKGKQREKRRKGEARWEIRKPNADSKKEGVKSKTNDAKDSWKVGTWSPLRIRVLPILSYK